MPTLLPPFTIAQPASLADASTLLRQHAEAASAYAGGTELLLAMKQAGLRYDWLVDLKTVPGLDGIELLEDSLRIGALATHRAVEQSALVRQHLPALAELEAQVANPRVRASGTLGGNLCFGEPRSDPATLLLCLQARLELSGPDGERELALADFFLGPYEVALRAGELLRAIRVPLPPPGLQVGYHKVQHRERPLLGLALGLELDGAGQRLLGGRLAVGAASPTPRRSAEAEALLGGPLATLAERLPAAAELLADAAELLDDLDGSAEYKRHLIRVELERLAADLLARASA